MYFIVAISQCRLWQSIAEISLEFAIAPPILYPMDT